MGQSAFHYWFSRVHPGYCPALPLQGYIYDIETGFYYLRSRYYKPTWNRFLNADTIISGNLFAYCRANPIAYSDKNGKCPIPSSTPGPTVIPGPTVPERDIILRQIEKRFESDGRSPFQKAQDTYSALNSGKTLLRPWVESSSEPTSHFGSSTYTYNWAARAAYDVAQAATDISGEIGSFVDAAFGAYGVPFQPGPYIDNGIQIISSLILPDTPPETHQYTIYRIKDEYKHSVDGYRYVSMNKNSVLVNYQIAQFIPQVL